MQFNGPRDPAKVIPIEVVQVQGTALRVELVID